MKDKNKMMTHIKEHIDYPTTKQGLIDACNGMSDISDEDKELFKKNLPERSYESADEVIEALGM